MRKQWTLVLKTYAVTFMFLKILWITSYVLSSANFNLQFFLPLLHCFTMQWSWLSVWTKITMIWSSMYRNLLFVYQLTHQSVSLSFCEVSPNMILDCKALTIASSPRTFKVGFYLQKLKRFTAQKKSIPLLHSRGTLDSVSHCFPVGPDGRELTDSGDPQMTASQLPLAL